MKKSALTLLILLLACIALPAAAQSVSSVELKWLGEKPPTTSMGVSWGTPWPRGKVRKDQAFTLATADGKSLPLQSWPLAWWPDGSIKWSGFATVAGPETTGSLRLSLSNAVSPTSGPVVQVRPSDTTFEIDTGRLKVRIPRSGSSLIDSMAVDGREVARHGRLVCILQDGPDGDGENVPMREKYSTKVERVTMEQSGPVRAVARIEGKHRGVKSNREWLPFVVRLYFYAGQESIRMVHSVVYDGDESKDFIRGLGVSFSVPMREQIQNRHVRFSGEGSGLWSEPIQPMIGRGGRFVAHPQTGADVYPDQIAGKRVPNKEAYNSRGQGLLGDWAVWDDFKLVQPNADGFTVLKRTNPESAWIAAGAGRRASGLIFAGDVSGGLAASLKNFGSHTRHRWK
jgi:PcRGLX-like protein central beta sandwich domain/PcRGLX-like N-terminal RIFT barrel domain